MKVLLLSNDLVLKNDLEDIGVFTDIALINSMDNIKNDFDIIVISDKLVTYNDLTIFYNKYQSLLSNKHVFYMLSNYNSQSIIDNAESICRSKGMNVIHPRRTNDQIKSIILNNVLPGIYSTNRNVITFVGADNKVGTTMTSTTVAELLSQNTYSDVLLMHLNKEPSTYYINGNDAELSGISNLRLKLTNNILTADEIKTACIQLKENLYVLPGVSTIGETRYYLPEHIENLFKLAASQFSIIVVDAGAINELDFQGGMTIAALTMAFKKYLVTTQQQVSYEQFDRINTQSLNRLGISSEDFLLIINKYYNFDSSYSQSQVANRYKMVLAGSLPYLDMKGWQAEFDKCTLYSYKDKEYNAHIEDLTKVIAEQLGFASLLKKEKVSKKGFFNYWPFKSSKSIGG